MTRDYSKNPLTDAIATLQAMEWRDSDWGVTEAEIAALDGGNDWYYDNLKETFYDKKQFGIKELTRIGKMVSINDMRLALERWIKDGTSDRKVHASLQSTSKWHRTHVKIADRFLDIRKGVLRFVDEIQTECHAIGGYEYVGIVLTPFLLDRLRYASQEVRRKEMQAVKAALQAGLSVEDVTQFYNERYATRRASEAARYLKQPESETVAPSAKAEPPKQMPKQEPRQSSDDAVKQLGKAIFGDE
jgi:hypothetical protein